MRNAAQLWDDLHRFVPHRPEAQARENWLRANHAAVALQRIARGRMQRIRFSLHRDAEAHTQWLAYYLNTGQYDMARSLGWCVRRIMSDWKELRTDPSDQ